MKYDILKRNISELKDDDLIVSLKLAGKIIWLGEKMKKTKEAIDEALAHDQANSLGLLEVRMKQYEKEIFDIRRIAEESISDPALAIDILDHLLEEANNA